MTRGLRGWCLVLLLLGSPWAFMGGCVSTNPAASTQPGRLTNSTGGSGGKIVEVELYTSPVPVNWDKDPAVDGIAARVLLFQADPPAAVPLRHGKLEMRLYDGRLTAPQLAHAKPLHIWRFTPNDMVTRASQTMVGVAYEFRLDWGRDVPRQNAVTLLVRYVPAGGEPIESATTVIPTTTGR